MKSQYSSAVIQKTIEQDAWRLSLSTYAEYVSDGRWKAWPWLKYVADAVETEIFEGNGRIIINAPPQHGKSELISHWLPTWYLDLFPEKRVILASYADSLASNFGRIVRNELSRNDFCWEKLAQDSHAADDWKTQSGGGMVCVGVSGGITGRGGDLIIVDDPISGWVEAQSELQRSRLIDWFNGTLYTRKQPGTTIVVIQTRWHEDDLTGYLCREHADTWLHLNLPALAEENDPLDRKMNTSLCEERFDREALEQIRNAIGSHMFAGLYQQRPAPLSGGIIKKHWLRFWYQGTPPPNVKVAMEDGSIHTCHQVELPPAFDYTITSSDLSFKDNKENSYVAMGVFACLQARRFWLDLVHDHLDFVHTLSNLEVLRSKWPDCTAHFVEDKANGPAIMSMLKDKVPGMLAIPADGSVGSKIARVEACSPSIEAGNLYLPHPTMYPWVEKVITEICTFPKSKHSDLCFVAGTKIATLCGSKNIEDICVGDRVLTPYGLRKVLGAGQTGTHSVVTNVGLTGTAKHPIYSKYEFLHLDSITQDVIHTLTWIHQIQWAFLSLWTSWEYVMFSCHTQEDIIYPTMSNQQKGCMSLYGSFLIIKKFHLVIMCIISITIHSIMTQIIYYVSQVLNTGNFILRWDAIVQKRYLNTWIKSVGKLKLGILQKKEKNGISNTEKMFGLVKKRHKKLVACVKNIFTHIGTVSIVVHIVDTCTEKVMDDIKPKGYVSCVEKNLSPTSRQIQKEQAKLVDAPVDIMPVFNLKVDGGLYYANSVLVHNCDAMSQALNWTRQRSGGRYDYQPVKKAIKGRPVAGLPIQGFKSRHGGLF